MAEQTRIERGNQNAQRAHQEIVQMFSSWRNQLQPKARTMSEGIRAADPKDDKSTPEREMLYSAFGFARWLSEQHNMNISLTDMTEMFEEVMRERSPA